MQAITTKYIGPSNVRGSRIKARCQAGSLTMDYNDAFNSDQNHATVALALADKLQWGGRWIYGFDFNEHGVFVMIEEEGFHHASPQLFRAA